MIKNRLLKRQLKKAKITNLDDISPQSLKKLLSLVESAYDEMDGNVYRQERSLEISSNELRELNDNLEKKIKLEVEQNRYKDEKIFHQSRSAAMGEMIANIAHQWRQPLSAISTTASSMKLQLELDISTEEEVVESFDHILEYTNFLSQTIEDFRGFLDINEKKREFTISEVIDKTMSIVKAVYKENRIKIIYNKNTFPYKSFGLSNTLAQAVLNILNNAKDAFDIHNKDKKVFIHLDNEDGYNIISIQDSALGIKEEILQKIFDPYFTTKHQSQGTGIGLYMCKEIIEKHIEGTIEARNNIFVDNNITYKGLEFVITIPIS
mgnify:CR=1 FL=1